MDPKTIQIATLESSLKKKSDSKSWLVCVVPNGDKFDTEIIKDGILMTYRGNLSHDDAIDTAQTEIIK